MTETKQNTEQTNVAQKITARRIIYVFIVTDSLTNSVLEQQGLKTIFATTKQSLTAEQLSSPNEDTTNRFIRLVEHSTVGLSVIHSQHTKQLDLLGIKSNIAIPPYGVTWRDLALNGCLAPNKQEKTLNRAYTQTHLFLAKSEQQAANLYLKRHSKNNTFIFPFKDCLYKAVVKHPPDNTDPTINVTQLTDCSLFFEYSVVDDTKKHRISHHLFLCSEREGSSRVQLTDNDFAKATAFSTALQKNRQSFYGNTG